jgi:hypothetical protein
MQIYKRLESDKKIHPIPQKIYKTKRRRIAGDVDKYFLGFIDFIDFK